MAPRASICSEMGVQDHIHTPQSVEAGFTVAIISKKRINPAIEIEIEHTFAIAGRTKQKIKYLPAVGFLRRYFGVPHPKLFLEPLPRRSQSCV